MFDGYNPEMQAVHESNAGELDTIIAEIGWPTPEQVGDEGAEAAWLIAQHAIGLPHFQRKCLGLLKPAVNEGNAPAWQMAMVHDRILTFEGQPQIYGTQFDWDDSGQLSPRPTVDPDGVDQRRAQVGLGTLEAATLKHRAQSAAQPRPADLAEHRKRMDDWAHLVGWR